MAGRGGGRHRDGKPPDRHWRVSRVGGQSLMSLMALKALDLSSCDRKQPGDRDPVGKLIKLRMQQASPLGIGCTIELARVGPQAIFEQREVLRWRVREHRDVHRIGRLKRGQAFHPRRRAEARKRTTFFASDGFSIAMRRRVSAAARQAGSGPCQSHPGAQVLDGLGRACSATGEAAAPGARGANQSGSPHGPRLTRGGASKILAGFPDEPRGAALRRRLGRLQGWGACAAIAARTPA